MQTRYLLAVFSDAGARESARRGIDDRLLFARRDFTGRASLWARHREQVCHIASGNGVALGLVVARRESATRLHRSPARDFAPASDITLDDLLKETWGNYIAFETETSKHSATVLRSLWGRWQRTTSGRTGAGRSHRTSICCVTPGFSPPQSTGFDWASTCKGRCSSMRRPVSSASASLCLALP
jgi:hypothetical protein